MRASTSIRLGLLIALIAIAQTVPAQDSKSSVAGTVTSSKGAPIVAAKISAKNLNTGLAKDVQTDSSGSFHLDDLENGDYEISVTAEGFVTQTKAVNLSASAPQSVSFSLSPGNPDGAGLPNAPSATQSGPSLSDLGFPPEATQSNAKQQALLDKRTHMLKIHQKLGLITAAPLVATLVASVGAGGRNTAAPIGQSTWCWEQSRRTSISPARTLPFALQEFRERRLAARFACIRRSPGSTVRG